MCNFYFYFNLTDVPRSTVPTVGTYCFLCFPATDPIDPVCFRSAPLSSDNFLTTGFRSSFRRKSSGTQVIHARSDSVGSEQSRHKPNDTRTGILTNGFRSGYRRNPMRSVQNPTEFYQFLPNSDDIRAGIR